MRHALKGCLCAMLLALTFLGTSACQSEKRSLTVVLYPYIPEYEAVKSQVKTAFEESHPEIQLKFVDLPDGYYSPGDKQYILTTKANVYELDSVFLEDFTQSKKIKPWPEGTLLPEGELLKNAAMGSRVGNTRYGAAHWVCGNFLFFRAGDPAFANISRLSDVESAIGSSHAKGAGLVTDLKGKSTLGEFYLETAFDHYGDWQSASSHLAKAEDDLTNDLKRLTALCDAGNCRSGNYHDNDAGIYARLFDDGQARAFIGYSESMRGALTENTHCSSAKCLKDQDLDVTGFPSDDNGRHQISWVDSFVLDVDCNAQCEQDAVAFIKFMISDATYKQILLHSSAVPEYLLPAKASLYSDAELLRAAHLYPKLRTIIEGAYVPSAPGLNEELRARGKDVDGKLPQ